MGIESDTLTTSVKINLNHQCENFCNDKLNHEHKIHEKMYQMAFIIGNPFICEIYSNTGNQS
jgi:hypothetical protein